MSDERITGQGAVDNGGRSPEYSDDLTQQERAKAGDLGASAGMGGSNLSNTGMGSNEMGNSTSGTGTGRSNYNDTATGARTADIAGATDTSFGGGATGTRSSGGDAVLTGAGTSAGYGSATAGTSTAGTGPLGGGYNAGPRGDNIDDDARDRTEDVNSDETGTLISADKVQGTAVYDASGERLGTIDSLMLNKRSGKVAYAVMSFGGFLGIGERYHPLPWNVLTYDTDKGGYNIGQTTDQIRGAPNYSRDEIDDGDFSSRGREVDDYYGRASTGAATGII
ncbi:PRC-barrel domain-containing protein [Glacieibacterium sp.]|uniref:PRC-barrel domain-containing protein n=1 Tax=Glacieibacterium sp. TaxID=2860237 RepID=UPI003B00192B